MPTLHMDQWVHQEQLMLAPWAYLEVEYFFLIGGYGCGKTSADVMFLISLCQKYYNKPISIGLGGSTITLLRKTLVAEFERMLIMTGSSFSDNKQENVIRVGQVEIVLIALDQPNLLYAYNFSIFIADELDELTQEKALMAFTAIQERTRKTLPCGRIPFTVFTTTAQGYSGTYVIVEQLKKLKQKHIIIRGETKANKALSKSFVDRLYALYDENERLAYLEGRFVNLNTGRVYGDFDSSRDSVDIFDYDNVDVISIGQDLNTGFSKAVAVVKEDGKIYIVKTFSFAQIGAAPEIIRAAFPVQDIIWYPDASSKEVMNGYLEEIRSHDIELRMGSVNPSVVERIFFVNKLFKTERMKIVRKNCLDLEIALKTRQFDELGKPEKGRGSLAPDHVCLRGDTIVYTSDGDKCIREVRVGDNVLTRKGYRKVLASGKTGERPVKSVFGVFATNDHPFYNGKDFVHADCLNGYDIPYVVTEKEQVKCRTLNQILSYLTEQCTKGPPQHQRDTRGCTSTLLGTLMEKVKASRELYTEKSGRKSMGLYLWGTVYTIRMVTLLITVSVTLSVLRRGSTYQTILENLSYQALNTMRRVLKRGERRQRNGIAVLRGVNGIAYRLKAIVTELRSGPRVSTVESRSLVRIGLCSVLEGVFLPIVGLAEWIMNAGSACIAGLYSLRTGTQRLSHVQEVAPLGCETREEVFNMTVDQEHEFFANGVLVSNCDGLEYVVWRIVSSDRDYMDLWELSRTAKRDNGYGATLIRRSA